MHGFIIGCLLFFIVGFTPATYAFQAQCTNNTTFNIGAGIYDITGPAAEQGMMGYGMLAQRTTGILMRLYARAFVIESPCNGKRVVLLNADLGMIFQAVKLAAIQKLKQKYGDLYQDDNVLMTATHTHSGPGGFSTYFFYNITTLGFSRENFNVIVDGIVAAISMAHHSMQPGIIKIVEGELAGISHNRSKEAYLLNPAAERAQYQNDYDSKMTLLRFDNVAGEPIGLFNWFPLHGVSFNNKNTLINGDNKGYAEYLFEEEMHHSNHPNFVAAFGQAHAGDISPNPYGTEGGKDSAGLVAMINAGRPQYETAKQLFQAASQSVVGGVDYKHKYVEMEKEILSAALTENHLCTAAIGISMLAGTQDGEGVGKQGITCDKIHHVIPQFLCESRRTLCQGVKPIAIETGSMKPHPWTPNILPLQVIRIGNLVIAAAPFELTTMTGRRILKSMQKRLPADHKVVIAALSNAYAGYVATFEEYQMQRYEGASTHFGPWSALYLQQVFAELTKALTEGLPVNSVVYPPNLLDSQISLQPGVVFDSTPLSRQFGDVYQQPQSRYRRGSTVQVYFWGAHPKNNLRIQDTFLAVQYWVGDHWQTVRTDRDPDTVYQWERSGVANSLISITWRIPQDMPVGSYRIVHYGDAKSFWTRKITPYSGYSKSFEVI